MAKKLRDEDLVLNIIVNGDQGRSEIKQLTSAVSDMKIKVTELEAKRKKLTAAGKEDTVEWRDNERAIKSNNHAISVAEDRLKVLRSGIKLTDMSMRDLSREQRRLKALMDVSVPGTENYTRYRNELDLVRARMQELGGQSQRTSMSIGKMADGVNRYIGLVAAFTGSVTMGVMAARKASDAYAEYDDKLADVMKTTGLAKEQSEELSETLSKIDTRTSQLELLGLARQAGKLGISAKEDVEAFVVAADKIGVALGEDLGDKEGAINSMGKLVDLFKVKDQYGMADGMIRVGSAVNALGAASTANEDYIVDFTQQVGGMAQQAGISIQNILGLGATLDKFGQRSEASATVIGRVISGMHKNTVEYANIAKMTISDFTELLSKDANEAMMRVFENMGGGGMQKVVTLLGDLGETGVRASQVLSTLSANTSTLRVQQDLANNEFEKGTSVIAEYYTKNESAQAKLEKVRKVAQERLVELGRILQPVMSGMTSGFSTLIKVMSVAVKFFIEYRAVILYVTAATVTYIAVQKISANWSKIQSYWTGINAEAIKTETIAMAKCSVGTKLLAAAKMLLAGQFRAAAIAAKSFWVSLGPIGWAVIGITAITTAMSLFKKSTNSSNLAFVDMALSIKREKDTLSDLEKAITESKEGSIERANAIRVLNENYSEYLPNLQTEKDSNESIALAIQSVNEKLEENIRVKFRASETERLRLDQFNSERDVLVKLGAAYNELGDKTPAQIDLMNTKFVEMIDNLKETGDKTAFATQMASVFGQEWGRVNYLGARGRGGSEINATYDLIITSFDIITKKAKETSNALFLVNAIAGKPITPVTITPGNVVCEKCGKTPCECYKVEAENKQQWTLDNDTKFNEQRVALKRKQLDGAYATEEEFSSDILNLEIATLEARIATKKDKGAELAKIQEQLLDKQLSKAKDVKKREQDLTKIAQGGDTELQKAQREYEERLLAAKLNIDNMINMTATEKAALLQIEKEHAGKISSINLKGLQDNLEKQKKALDKKLTVIRLAQAEELATADTLVKKKVLLGKWFSAEELREVKTAKEADKLLKSKYSEDEQTQTKEELTNILETYQAMAAELKAKGSLMNGTVKLTEDDAAKLQEIIDKLRAELAKLGQDPKATIDKSKCDALGMTTDDWANMFKNSEDGLTSLQKMEIAAKAIGNAFNDVSNLMAAIEQRDLKNYEKSQNKKKQALDRQLKSGAISQEAYNSRVQAIDEQTEAKRIEMERKQAERQKAMAVFSAITSTAVAVVSALGSTPFGPWNIALAAVIGALGAVQVGAILATPLPGLEAGGRIRVRRQQDGKPFDADFDPDYRGWVDRPKVIVGEGQGRELVIPAEGELNPTVRPVLDILGRAIANKQIRSINLTAEMQRYMIPGRASGGRVSDSVPAPSITPNNNDNQNYTEVLSMISQLMVVLDSLNNKLDGPIEAQVVMTGDKGLAKQYDKYNKTVARATIGG